MHIRAEHVARTHSLTLDDVRGGQIFIGDFPLRLSQLSSDQKARTQLSLACPNLVFCPRFNASLPLLVCVMHMHNEIEVKWSKSSKRTPRAAAATHTNRPAFWRAANFK